MRLFVDTANVKEIYEAAELGVVTGVTTNPSLAAKEGISDPDAYKKTVQEIAKVISGPISVEVVSTEAKDMIEEGLKIADWIDNVWVKIPSTLAGFEAIHKLSDQGINTNQTLCFSTNQAILGAQAGSTVVSPFVGRLDDIAQDGMAMVGEIVEIYRKFPTIKTQVMAASIRHPFHCHQAALMGADISTVPFGIIKKMAEHPLTDKGMELFLNDWYGSK
ncbi:MAG: fructose-6-phosphate aldolase [SAR202 cluster bacterium]|nr:fructose-6-phosphate aldolase [Chloroflexota bacterium]MQG17600.1 fructose-6-phosphate aldolase [SAR202 cluster bacterium]MQG35982.1 fructose-6-phosphate aldolase [SAR202 cluster bacterium]MQG86966.1 fructose-6-phosphate aldolase [SAR202 cluster bacterium]